MEKTPMVTIKGLKTLLHDIPFINFPLESMLKDKTTVQYKAKIDINKSRATDSTKSRTETKERRRRR
jgi:hypothetical protein